MDNCTIRYCSTDITDIELIRPLWELLNEHHRQNAREFRNQYAEWDFNDRKEYFVKLSRSGSFCLELAFDQNSGACIGYCIGSLSAEMTGEIESIFIREAYRSQGVGTALMHRILAWLAANHSVRIRVSVAAGNEAAFPFYRKFGFFPRMTVLELKRG